MQTRFLASFYVAPRRVKRLLPANIVADCRRASPGVFLRWPFVWLFRGILPGWAAAAALDRLSAPVQGLKRGAGQVRRGVGGLRTADGWVDGGGLGNRRQGRGYASPTVSVG